MLRVGFRVAAHGDRQRYRVGSGRIKAKQAQAEGRKGAVSVALSPTACHLFHWKILAAANNFCGAEFCCAANIWGRFSGRQNFLPGWFICVVGIGLSGIGSGFLVAGYFFVGGGGV